MSAQQLAPPARQWLDRVIERILTMARAHDLFSGGMSEVDLRQLVDQVLPSLSILKPPGVTIKTDLDGVACRFSTPQAVSLAMVLHELCSNAIVHGIGEQGTLTIRARRTPGGAGIDVIDPGQRRGS